MPVNVEDKHLLQYQDLLKQFIAHFVQPTDEEWNELLNVVQYESFQKGQKIVSKEIPCNKLFFIIEGIARHHILNEDQLEITTWFNSPGSLVTDFAGFTTGEPQPFIIQAITPVVAISITNTALQKLYDQSQIWERMGRLINQHYLIELIKRNNGMLNKTARERYEEFMELHGSLFKVVPLKYIASYLNISLETLSRLRSNSY
jgi:CRP-like cAMP-binding protein